MRQSDLSVFFDDLLPLLFQQLPSLSRIAGGIPALASERLEGLKREPVDVGRRSLPWIAGFLAVGGGLHRLFDMPEKGAPARKPQMPGKEALQRSEERRVGKEC